MDREQHYTQDAAEHYAVYKMAKVAEGLGIASRPHSDDLWQGFLDYLAASPRNWSLGDFTKHYPQYKENVDKQVPRFVAQLKAKFPGSLFEFAIDEATFRNLGLKADVTIRLSTENAPRHVSLKNYIGKRGIDRPQVSSGTFLSFAAGFVFERTGVGTYLDPRTGRTFKGADQAARNSVLEQLGLRELVKPLQTLEDLNSYAREELLRLQFYDERAFRAVIEKIVPAAQGAILTVFGVLGLPSVRRKFLQRTGLDESEDVLFFDNRRLLDSLTNDKFNLFRRELSSPSTNFEVLPVGQGLSFQFTGAAGANLLSVHVPLTINANGAWHRPRRRYEGTRVVDDKGKKVELAWGQLRPRKSRELATSTNTYVNLRRAGII